MCCGALLLFGLSFTGWKSLIVPTGSMRPTITPGSLVFVHRVPVSSLKVGDVITYINPLHPSSTLSHRVIRKYLIDGRVPGFVTKGDANKIADVPVAGGAVEGKVVWHVTNVGRWLLDIKRPIVILPVVYVAALLIMIEEVQRLSEYYRRLVLYRLPGFARHDKVPGFLARKARMGAALTAVFVLIGAVAGPSALALLRSNTVSLTDNRISAGTIPPGNNKCSGSTSNNNNINVNNSTTQTATSGNASSSGNTNGGSATSGSASNSNTTTVNITVTNCH
jgi:signal peptidase I